MKFFKNDNPPEEKMDLDEIARAAETGEWEKPSFDPEDELDEDRLFEENGEWIKLNNVMDKFRPKTEKGRKKALAFIHAGLALTVMAGIAAQFEGAVVATPDNPDGNEGGDGDEEPPPKIDSRTVALLEAMDVIRNEQIQAGYIASSDMMYDLEREYYVAADENDDITSDRYQNDVIDGMFDIAKESGNVRDLMLARSKLENKNDMDALYSVLRNADGVDFKGEDKQELIDLNEDDLAKADDRNEKIAELTTLIEGKINMPIPEGELPGGELSDAQKDEMSENFQELKVLYTDKSELKNNGDSIYANIYKKAMASGRISDLFDAQEIMRARELEGYHGLELSYSQQSAEFNKLERKIFDTIALLPEGKTRDKAKQLLYEKDYGAVAALCNKNGIA